jgi:hypothetical protein
MSHARLLRAHAGAFAFLEIRSHRKMPFLHSLACVCRWMGTDDEKKKLS